MTIVAVRSAVGSGLLAQSFSPVVRSCNNSTDTADFLFATKTIVGGTMGPNSRIEIITHWTYFNSVTNKTLSTYWGGTSVSGPTVSTSTAVKHRIEICNSSSLTAQTCQNASTFNTNGTFTSTTKDTSADVVIDIKGKWAANLTADSETITLLGYSIWHYPGS